MRKPKATPNRGRGRDLDVVAASANDRISDMVAATVLTFLDHEETESLAVVEQLLKQIHLHGLAVAGVDACMLALRAGQADILVIVKDYKSDSAGLCPACGCLVAETETPRVCPQCASAPAWQFDIKEEMVRLAQQTSCHVEAVEHSDALMRLGGVGCLLRYAAVASYAEKAA